MSSIAIVCGSFHREYVARMLTFAKDRADQLGLDVIEEIWVPGSMEVPLALDRLLSRDDISGAACLGIIEKGQTSHGEVMGEAVLKTIIELQLLHNKPIGLGIIGPGAESHHIESRLLPHSEAAIDAIDSFL